MKSRSDTRPSHSAKARHHSTGVHPLTPVACLALLVGLPACGADNNVPQSPLASSAPPTQFAKPEKPMKLGMPQPKRVGPPQVSPVVISNIRYEVIHWGRERGLGQNGGYVAAIDTASGKELWTSKIYAVEYKPKLETDVQDVFIKTMVVAPDGQSLLISDENNRHFVLDVATHVARPAP